MSFSSQLQPGLWPSYRRDDNALGHQPLPGDIRVPEVAWRHKLGGPIFDGRGIQLANGRRLLLVLFGGCAHAYDAASGELIWRSPALGLESLIGVEDVDCDGRTEIVAADGRSVYLLDAATGELLWREYFGPPWGGGFMPTTVLLHRFAQMGEGWQLAVGMVNSKEVAVYDLSPGARNPERLHILWMDDFFHPTVLAADIDGDGEDELIVTKYSAVYVFDPATGRQKGECRWSSGGTPKRNYGLFQILDIDGDGRLDMLVMSYVVSRHIAVIENTWGTHTPGGLVNRWDRFIEHVYPSDECELRYTDRSCVDLDANGSLEIVASIYNDRGDGRWRMDIMDAWSGEIRGEFNDLYLHDIITLPDGPAILASVESERNPDERSTLLLLTWNGSELTERVRIEGAGTHGRFVRQTPRSTVFKSELPPADGILSAIVDNELVIPLRLANDRLGLWRPGVAVAEVAIDVPWDCAVAAVAGFEDIDGDGTPELLLSDCNGTLTVLRPDGKHLWAIECGYRLRHGSSLYYQARPASVPTVVDRNGDRYCIVPTSGWDVVVLEWDPEALVPNEVLRLDGRGSLGPEESRHSVNVVEWDGAPAMLLSEIAESGGTVSEAALRLVGLDGAEIIRFIVPSLPATPRVARGRTGIHEAIVVNTDGGPLLLVSGFRSGSMNSELTTAFNMPSGEQIWERIIVNGETEDGRGFGPWNGITISGREEYPSVAFLAKDTFCEVDPWSGDIIGDAWRLRPYNTAALRRRGMSMDDFTAYGTPVSVILNSAGEQAWVLLAHFGGIGAINPDHTMRWWRSAPLASLTSAHGGVADIDGDGITEIGISYADGDFVCLRSDTGEEKWRLHLGVVATGIVTCDIDGDGRPEFILGSREGELIALGAASNGAGLVRWRMKFDYSIGPVVVADFDGDGASEILFVCGDGYLYSVTDRQRTVSDNRAIASSTH